MTQNALTAARPPGGSLQQAPDVPLMLSPCSQQSSSETFRSKCLEVFRTSS
jgi:hypothetical protein